MKHVFIGFLICFSFGFIQAQQRDLNFYLAQAKAHSPLIHKSQNDNIIVDLDLDQINKMLTNPQVDVNVNVLLAPIISHDNNMNKVELSSAGANHYSGYDLAISNGGQYVATVSVKQPLFTKTKYQDYAKRADVLKQINNNAINLNTHELTYLIENQYLLCLKSKQQSDVSATLEQQLKATVKVMEKLVQQSVYKPTDLMILKLEHQNYEMKYKTNLAQFKANLYDLNLLCGINDTTVVTLKPADLNLNSKFVNGSNFLKSYQLDSLHVLANQKIYNQKYLPQVNLFADAGMNAVYRPAFNRLGFSTGLALSWTIFDGHQKKIQNDKAQIQLETLHFDKSNFETKHNLNKDKILNQLQMVQERLLLISKQLSQYKDLLQTYQKTLSQGLVSIIDLKTITRDYTLKQMEALQLQSDKLALINTYNYWNY